ncbi:MAG: hypothetical protein KC776_12330 [Myxococcales bacterium]|nr:hypothetical protein [Myxococcales bacterium]MCB9580985.1 hypothetical protein [Polyangiaceae bacterium]
MNTLHDDLRLRQLSLEFALASERLRRRVEELTGERLAGEQLLQFLSDATTRHLEEKASELGVVDFALERAKRIGSGAAKLTVDRDDGPEAAQVTVGLKPGQLEALVAAFEVEAGTQVLKSEVLRAALEKGIELLLAEHGIDAGEDGA